MSSKSETFLVTGASGFIGSQLARHLHNEGAHVLAGMRDPDKGKFLTSQGIEVVKFDLEKPQDFQQVLPRVRTIFNVGAWMGRAPMGTEEAYLKQQRGEKLTRQEQFQAEAWGTNVIGNRDLIDAAIRANVRRFVDTSSVAVYGLPTKGIITEESPTAPYDAYSETKLASKGALFERKYEIEVVIIRPAQVIGEQDSRWTLQPFEKVRDGQIVLVGSGKGTFNPTYIGNLVKLFELASQKSEAVGQVYNGVDTTITFGEYVQYFERMLEIEAKRLRAPLWSAVLAARALEFVSPLTRIHPPLSGSDLRFLDGQVSFSNEKARKELGWVPTVSIPQAMVNIENWLKETGKLSSASRS